MTVPSTYLHTAPSGSGDDSLGNAIDANVMLRKLKALNPRISFQQRLVTSEYNGESIGSTCMWVGEPGGVSRKVTAFNMGQIPEFTLLAPDGHIVLKGWRAIFERVIRVAGVKRADIERAFGVTLEAGERDRVCQQCIRESGKVVKVTGADLLCNFHLGVKQNVCSVLDAQEETRDRVKEAKRVRETSPVSLIVP